ncbi:hypothetical protein QAD02_002161 [Eretmocerus hayati]|uniref:Uncharacterized protein n=1 Tax=Eretmocerus hayati TaxID=131215 RepID=A0ACC2NL01_9HYME|nr:hypothetical protein QAD02_002161 [Eretmocerus hayati]
MEQIRFRYKNQAFVFKHPAVDQKVREQYFELMGECRVSSIIEPSNDFKIFGCGKELVSTSEEKGAVENTLGHSVVGEYECYDRFMYKKKMFTCESYTRAGKRSNATIITNDHDFARVASVPQVRSSTSNVARYVIIGRKLLPTGKKLCIVEEFDPDVMWSIVRETTEVTYLEYSAILNKCMSIPAGDDLSCVIPIINRVETD